MGTVVCTVKVRFVVEQNGYQLLKTIFFVAIRPNAGHSLLFLEFF
jgi:hypothetical protein